MRTKIAAVALTAGLAAGGVALVVPGSAFASGATTSTPTTSPSTGATDPAAQRRSSIKDALKVLVTDGTITQAQADKVASTLSSSHGMPGGWAGGRGMRGGWAGGRGMRGGHLSPDALAGILGVTTTELRTQLQAGKTLTQIAQTKGISKADLINKLVAAAKTQLAADVKAGTITQAQADTATSALTADITNRVDQVRPAHSDHDQMPNGTPSAAATS